MVVVVAMTTAGLVVVGAGGRDCVVCEWRRRGRMRRGLPWVQCEAGRRKIGAESPRGREILLPALTLK